MFLNKKFPSAKVFGLEGCDALINGLTSVAMTASALGVESIEMVTNTSNHSTDSLTELIYCKRTD